MRILLAIQVCQNGEVAEARLNERSIAYEFAHRTGLTHVWMQKTFFQVQSKIQTIL